MHYANITEDFVSDAKDNWRQNMEKTNFPLPVFCFFFFLHYLSYKQHLSIW